VLGQEADVVAAGKVQADSDDVLGRLLEPRKGLLADVIEEGDQMDLGSVDGPKRLDDVDEQRSCVGVASDHEDGLLKQHFIDAGLLEEPEQLDVVRQDAILEESLGRSQLGLVVGHLPTGGIDVAAQPDQRHGTQHDGQRVRHLR